MTIRAVTFDAYGTLFRNDDLVLIAQRIVDDHRLRMPVEDVYQRWTDLYYEATQLPPFRTLREMNMALFLRLLRELDVEDDATPAAYVDLFFALTTNVTLYPEVAEVLNALGDVPSAILSNADHEHLAAWTCTLPVKFILVSESVGAYKPDRLVFRTAVERLGLEPHEVLHVGDSDVDDVKGAKAAGLRVAWLNRNGRSRRSEVPEPDFEIRDLRAVPLLIQRV